MLFFLLSFRFTYFSPRMGCLRFIRFSSTVELSRVGTWFNADKINVLLKLVAKFTWWLNILICDGFNQYRWFSLVLFKMASISIKSNLLKKIHTQILKSCAKYAVRFHFHPFYLWNLKFYMYTGIVLNFLEL